ncbi:hypothetical protein ABTK55_20010, partial [Acinetobacter baumannii]
LAAANLGVITACLNWRLSQRELAYCIDLVSPKLLIVEEELAGNLELSPIGDRKVIKIGPQYEHILQEQNGHALPIAAESEDGL